MKKIDNDCIEVFEGEQMRAPMRIAPDYFKTEMTKALYEDEKFDAWLCLRVPANRWGDPEELIGAAIFLASNASNYVNGHILYVDGGLLACV